MQATEIGRQDTTSLESVSTEPVSSNDVNDDDSENQRSTKMPKQKSKNKTRYIGQ